MAPKQLPFVPLAAPAGTAMIPAPRRKPGRGGILRESERTRIALLGAQGVSSREIAKIVGCSRGTAVKVLKSEDARRLHFDVRQALRAHLPEFCELWIEAARVGAKRGDHRPVLAALVALKEIDQLPPAATPIHVQIGFALPGLPAPQGAATSLPPAPLEAGRREDLRRDS